MGHLSERDVRAVMDGVREIHTDPDLQTFPARLLRVVRKLVPGDMAAYEEMNLKKNRVVGISDPPEARPAPAHVQVFEQHMHEHPVVDRYVKTDDRRACTISDFISVGDYHRTEIYNSLYRDFATEDQLAASLVAPRPLMIGFAINRSRRTFTARDRQVFDLLQPHLLQAYRNAEAMTQIKAQAAWALGVHEAMDEGIVALGADGRVRSTTAKARAGMGRYFPASRAAAPHLPDSLASWVRHARQGVRNGELNRALTPLVVDGVEGRLTVRLVQHPDEKEGCLLLLTEQQKASAGPVDPRLASLPPRVRQLMEHLLAGDSEKQAAQKMGLSRHTVHDYAKALYERLAVTSRGELLVQWRRS